jgi:hypothetical protein
VVIAQNLIGRCDNDGVYPVLRPERSGAGTAQENYIHNNIFTACGKAAIVFLNQRNEADGNVYVSMPAGYLGFVTPDMERWLDLASWREAFGWDKNGAVMSMSLDFDPDKLELTTDAKKLPAVAVFNRIDTDIFGAATGNSRAPGPFADLAAARSRKIDPRATIKQDATPGKAE